MLLKARGWVLLSVLLAGTAWASDDSRKRALKKAGPIKGTRASMGSPARASSTATQSCSAPAGGF